MLTIVVSTLLFCSLSLGSATPKTYAASGDTNSSTGAIEVSRNGTEVRSENITFAIKGFLRSNKGTEKTYNDAYYGYRFPMSGADAFAVVVTDSTVIVYLPATRTQALSINPNGSSDQTAFKQLLLAIDTQVANGNRPLESNNSPYLFTTDKTVELNGYQYRFGVEVEDGFYYVCITSETDTLENSAGAIFVTSGLLVLASEVEIDRAPEGLEALWEFFGGIDYRPFWVSIRTSLVAMVFVFILGLVAAYYSLKIHERVRVILDSIFTIPMVLPPTVIGFLLLVVFGNSTGFGRWLIDHGIVLVFSWPGAVIAATVVAFPLMYRTARGAFESLDPNLGDAARTLGWSNSRIFFKLTMPLSWPSVAAGTVLAFARALGEFGATLFVAGNYAGVTQTMPLAIYFQWMGGRTEVAAFWVVVVILISFLVILVINWYASHTQRYRKAGSDIDEEMEGKRRGKKPKINKTMSGKYKGRVMGKKRKEHKARGFKGKDAEPLAHKEEETTI